MEWKIVFFLKKETQVIGISIISDLENDVTYNGKKLMAGFPLRRKSLGQSVSIAADSRSPSKKITYFY